MKINLPKTITMKHGDYQELAFKADLCDYLISKMRDNDIFQKEFRMMYDCINEKGEVNE